MVKALAKQQGDRSNQETRMLMEFFTEASCFKELDIKQQDLYKVVQKMEYKRMVARQVIFNIGDVGDYFYILIHGRVQLFLPNSNIPGV